MKRLPIETNRLLVEFLGTFFFVLTIAMTGNPLAIASMLMVWIYIGSSVSGAHYNPAVTLGVALTTRRAWNEVWLYMIAQVLGGIVAFATAFYLRGTMMVPAPAVGWLPAFIVEVLLAFVFVSIVLHVTIAKKFRASNVYGFVIGFSIPALALLGSPISGGLFNPAIALGASLFGAFKGVPIVWQHLVLYVGGALLGGYLAAIAFKYFLPTDER